MTCQTFRSKTVGANSPCIYNVHKNPFRYVLSHSMSDVNKWVGKRGMIHMEHTRQRNYWT